MNYTQALEFLGKRTKKNYMNNTTVRLEGDVIFVRLHDTDIVKLFPNGDIVLHTGGWKTDVTLNRMRYFINIHRSGGEWTVPWNGKEYSFEDGMILTSSGPSTEVNDPEKAKAMKKRIDKYVNAYVKKLVARELDAPGGGDCWMCSMGMPREHLESHMEEEYFVPSLILRANDEIPNLSQAHMAVLAYWFKNHEVKRESWEKFTETAVKRLLKRYMIRHLI